MAMNIPLLVAQESIVIKGRSIGRFKDLNVSIIDSIKQAQEIEISSNGTFRIVLPPITRSVLAQFSVNNDRFGTYFYLEPGVNVNADLNTSNLSESKIIGGPVQKLFSQWNELVEEQRQMVKECESELMPEFQSIMKQSVRSLEDTLRMDEIMDLIVKCERHALDAKKRFINKNLNTPVALYALYSCCSAFDTDEIRACYYKLPRDLRTEHIGRKIKQLIHERENFARGRSAPNFTMTSHKGEEISLYKVPAKLKIIDFWASWCAPCRKEIPNLKRLYKKYGDAGLEIISISLDTDRSAWLQVIEQDSLNWINISDMQGISSSTAQSYGVKNIPYMIVIDEDNRIIDRNLRGTDLNELIKKYFPNHIYDESNNGKKLFSDMSYLNKPMPNVFIDSWVDKRRSLHGKFVLYEFWSTYCAPCLAKVPDLNQIQEYFKDNLVIIAVAANTEDEVKALKKPEMNFARVTDPKSKNSKLLGFEGIPYSYLVSPEGIVIWEGAPNSREAPLTIEVINKLINKYK